MLSVFSHDWICPLSLVLSKSHYFSLFCKAFLFSAELSNKTLECSGVSWRPIHSVPPRGWDYPAVWEQEFPPAGFIQEKKSRKVCLLKWMGLQRWWGAPEASVHSRPPTPWLDSNCAGSKHLLADPLRTCQQCTCTDSRCHIQSM